ncbi:haloacid dehalogenase [Microbacterium oxydans]|uniref:HAD family hydrolase n=1 Tax=Microbacterium oxydans TaxID=82380 RepID=UPI00073429A4|nr:HAD family phosphatase [Microbacterium oxydans]KTR78825.1 haloacid dehalogenase [Microbacterium oxydans]
MIRVVLFDLDGVIRHFDASNTATIERRYDLAPGDIERIAFARPLIDEVTTGRITRAEWVRRIGARVGTAAAEEWSAQPAMIDDGVLELIDDVRETGIRTAVLTNGTDTIPAEIAAHGIASRFDAVFNSAEIGYAKPDTRAFRHVLDALDVKAAEVFFTDDSASKLVGAQHFSMHTHHYGGVDDLRARLVQAGVDVAANGGS